MDTLTQAIANKKISLVCEQVSSNYNIKDMPSGSTHWKCTLKKPGKRMIVRFSQGPAHYKKPTVECVLSCLISDYSCFLSCGNVKNFCNDLGYTNYLQGEKVFNAVVRQSNRLKAFLGNDLDYFINEVEPY